MMLCVYAINPGDMFRIKGDVNKRQFIASDIKIAHGILALETTTGRMHFFDDDTDVEYLHYHLHASNNMAIIEQEIKAIADAGVDIEVIGKEENEGCLE